MNPTRVFRTPVFMLCCCAAVAAWFASAGRPGSAGQPPAGDSARPAPAPEDRPADREAVRKALDGFVAAFQKGDAKAVAGHWTAEGEYISDDGATYRGHAALEKAYTEFFAKNPN